MISILTWCLLLTCALTGILASPQNRIVGGTDALPNEFPYHISLQGIRQNKYHYHMCSGSIIGDIWILTAARCVTPLSFLTVLVGTNKLDTGGLRYSIKRVITHKDYKHYGNTADNDIALIELEKSINESHRIISLANTLPPANSTCTLTGWRYLLGLFRRTSNNLQKYYQTFISISDCKKDLSRLPVSDTNVCTKSPRGISACVGDAGGPLVYNLTQIGILSWIPPCGTGGPDVFASVPAFRSWIKEQCNI